MRFDLSRHLLFEDEDFVIVNKPEFLSTLFDRSSETHLLQLVRNQYENVQVCHRLDKETSGALAFAKNAEAYRHMSMQFEHRKVEKIYHAVVDGLFSYKNVSVNKSIHVLNTGIARLDRIKGKEALTIFNTLKLFKKHTLVECKPVTGRLHQIRVHLSSLGAPITGDDTYGGRPFYLSEYKKKYKSGKFEEERPIMSRVALHARSLGFFDMKNEWHQVSAPYPKDIEVMLKQMEKFST
ncbi:MAG: RluA family pseudouridine synthase [Cyclobacteriaceae bacterium]|nr:RluA family pseudouridine synthase [Cyclobacteriaceae bacterium]